MGRRRSYDEHAVLTDVMHAFRRKGFHAVSVRDLEDAAAVSAGSLYHAYGDKAGVFDAALEHYNQAVLQARIDRFAPAETGLDGVRELFRSLLHEPDGGRFGCLITNSAIELGGGDPHPGVCAGLELLKRTFAERLAGAPDRGPGDIDLRATRLVALYQGVLVLVRAGCELSGVEHMIMAEFDELKRSATDVG